MTSTRADTASTLTVSRLTLAAADLGPANPLPPLVASADINTGVGFGPETEDLATRSGYGQVANVLPYATQDGYTRDLQEIETPIAVLENELLRATFLLGYGGRLSSLEHKPTGRELLCRNPTLQLANLSTTNAWFSGGVEWNIGVIGHSPLTCQPVHAARLSRPDGVPVLRMYEWERLRQVPFQIDAYLPPGSPVLYVHCRITNPHEGTLPMYWWSNIAVPETPDTRVLAPADAAWNIGHTRTVSYVPVPVSGGVDRSYPTRSDVADDYFFDIREARRPWIAALDGTGTGLVQTSTARLGGRKLFVWGNGPGGQRWQQFLSEPGPAYLEIQAGIASTQLEYAPMPPGARWSWVEAYGMLESDPQAVHGDGDWHGARAAAEGSLEDLVSTSAIEDELDSCGRWADQAPDEVLQHGSGWGALEQLRSGLGHPGTPFPQESIAAPQQPWLTLLRTGRFPETDPRQPPSAFMIQPEWRTLLEPVADDSWEAQLHLGLMRCQDGERDGARQAWERSYEIRANAWALRNLAVLDRLEGDLPSAVERYRAACELAPGHSALVIETTRTLLEAERPDAARDLLSTLPDEVPGRVGLLTAQTALALGDLDEVGRILDDGLVVEDLREADTALSDLWAEYQVRQLAALEDRPITDELRDRAREQYPLPARYDFRMSAD
ncbi:DUF5107 domain-containing protein [Luteipulveratus mongoliensis]|uniref:DUF5107 domain-containing protein n=1 Tax=Luteipulveratus mongoliensis TaxID=571913 RepID=A0A0K1JLU3_9MICO|nr:DUF5107 domain-containing protein [Luteipulveratus mongoliensis]AKU17682.1 hypothetical protein VV02_20590 [Luteipulveratus mongoliensis]